MTRLGRSAMPSSSRLSPALAWRRSRHLSFIAKPPSMMASEDPMEAAPAASGPLPSAWSRSASMATHRPSNLATLGYSSASTALTWAALNITFSASGSIQVVTKDARLRRGLASCPRSSSMSCCAVRAGISRSGSFHLGMGSASARWANAGASASWASGPQHPAVRPLPMPPGLDSTVAWWR